MRWISPLLLVGGALAGVLAVTLARKAPITCATLIGIVGPLLIAALLILGWIAW